MRSPRPPIFLGRGETYTLMASTPSAPFILYSRQSHSTSCRKTRKSSVPFKLPTERGRSLSFCLGRSEKIGMPYASSLSSQLQLLRRSRIGSSTQHVSQMHIGTSIDNGVFWSRVGWAQPYTVPRASPEGSKHLPRRCRSLLNPRKKALGPAMHAGNVGGKAKHHEWKGTVDTLCALSGNCFRYCCCKS